MRGRAYILDTVKKTDILEDTLKTLEAQMILRLEHNLSWIFKYYSWKENWLILTVLIFWPTDMLS